MKRSPIISVLGHVDHGKSSILDSIRESNILATEAGAITQAIGASIIPLEVLQKKCGSLLGSVKGLDIQGLLFIDTPGHAAFTSLRKRGGNLADIAILVVDINEGFKPQTIEAIEILKTSKTPFVVAANKLDLIPSYRHKDEKILADIKAQDEKVTSRVETKLYELVGKFAEMDLQSERFDRVDDFAKQLAIVPISAKFGWGIPELLTILVALTKKYLEENLAFNIEGPGKGSILEIKEEQGLGKTLDVIMYDGHIKINDTIVIGTLDEPLVTRVKALFEPAPLAEMRDKKSKFTSIKEAKAATGVKISAPELDGVVAGMPIQVATENIDVVKEDIMNEVEDVLIETEESGIIIKADNLGSLEGIIQLLNEHDIPIRKAIIGNITKKDVLDAESNAEEDPLLAVILAFNVKLAKDVIVPDTVKVITSDIIYRLLDDYEEWKEKKTKELEEKELAKITKPCKIQVLSGCIFRGSNPCVAGVEVLEGTLKQHMKLIKKDGSRLTEVKEIQMNKKSVSEAKEGEKVAVSMHGVMAERHVFENDIYYSDVNEENFRNLKAYAKKLAPKEKDLLKEIAAIKRKENPLWGV